MNESKASLFPQAWDKGDRIHLEDNITQQLTQVCTPTSLHKTMHINEVFRLHVAVCDVSTVEPVRNAKLKLCITELITVHDCEITIIILLLTSMCFPVSPCALLCFFLLKRLVSYYSITALFNF